VGHPFRAIQQAERWGLGAHALLAINKAQRGPAAEELQCKNAEGPRIQGRVGANRCLALSQVGSQRLWRSVRQTVPDARLIAHARNAPKVNQRPPIRTWQPHHIGWLQVTMHISCLMQLLEALADVVHHLHGTCGTTAVRHGTALLSCMHVAPKTEKPCMPTTCTAGEFVGDAPVRLAQRRRGECDALVVRLGGVALLLRQKMDRFDMCSPCMHDHEQNSFCMNSSGSPCMHVQACRRWVHRHKLPVLGLCPGKA
jgi:hypothetical protein